MDRRMCVLIMLFAALIALPQCATRQGAQPPAVAKAEAVKVVGADAHESTRSAPVGSVYRVNPGNREVLVRTKRILKMGERLYVEVDSAKAMMTATFPMLTSSKCTLEASSRKYFGQLSKGMPVYLYAPGEKKVARTEPKAGETKTIGGMEFVYIPAGSFMMGSEESPEELQRRYGRPVDWYRNEQPRHRVSVDGFWMGKYEVTQAQYQEIMGYNPSYFKEEGWISNSKRLPVEGERWYDAVMGINWNPFNEDGRRPVECVTWNQAQEFCKTFGEKHEVAVCLPTEAEWEYACRAGSESAYYWGDRIDGSYLWYSRNSGGRTNPVGEKRPNRFGLYDMSGNVWEWCGDWYNGNYYGTSPEQNPKGPERGQYRVLRGGSWHDYVVDNRSAGRGKNDPDIRNLNVGFRVVVPAGGK